MPTIFAQQGQCSCEHSRALALDATDIARGAARGQPIRSRWSALG